MSLRFIHRFVCFFFFKQKTAYEMRISDWSSDVCSSDLDACDGAPEGFKHAPVNSRGNPEVRFALEVYLEDCTGCGICVEVCPAHSSREQIGRASCRERVCQYV